MTAIHSILLILIMTCGISVVVKGQYLPVTYNSSIFHDTKNYVTTTNSFLITSSHLYYTNLILSLTIYDRNTTLTNTFPKIGLGNHLCGTLDDNTRGAYNSYSYHPDHGIMASTGFDIGLLKETEMSCFISQSSNDYSTPRYHKGNVYYFNKCSMWKYNVTTTVNSILLGNSSGCSQIATLDNMNTQNENIQSPYSYTIDNDFIYIFTNSYFIVYSKGSIIRKVKSTLPASPGGGMFKLRENILIVLLSNAQIIRLYIDTLTYQVIYQPNTNSEPYNCDSIQLIDSTIYAGDGPYIMALNPKCPEGYFLNMTLYSCTAMCFGKTINDSNICSGRGICIGNDMCNCNIGYGGSNCELVKCFGFYSNQTNNVCSRRGNCTLPDQCNCKQDFSGANCDYYECYSISFNNSNVCSGSSSSSGGKRGVCSAPNSCQCKDGYVGNQCEYTLCFDRLNTDPLVCSTHGICTFPNNCTCSQGLGWSGLNCNITQCFGKANYNPSVCGGHGLCNSLDNCTCSQGYTGNECQFESCNGKLKSDPNVCSSRGDCFASKGCICKNGFIGNDCQYYELIMNSDLTLTSRIQINSSSFSSLDCSSFTEWEILGIGAKCYTVLIDQLLTIQLGYLHRVGNGTILYERENSFLVVPINFSPTTSNTIQIKRINSPHPKDQTLTIRLEKNNAFSLFGKQWNKFFIGNQTIGTFNNYITLNASKLSTFDSSSTLNILVQSTNVFGVIINSSTLSISLSSSGPSFELLNDLSGNILSCNGYDCIIEYSVKNYGTKISSRFDNSYSFFGASSEQLLRLSNIMNDNTKSDNQYSGNLNVIGSLNSQFTSTNTIQLDYSLISSIIIDGAQLIGINKNHLISNDLNIQVYFNNPLINLLSRYEPIYSWTCQWFNGNSSNNRENIDCSTIVSSQLTIKSSNLKLGTYYFNVNIGITGLKQTLDLNGQVNINSTAIEIDIDTIAYNYPFGRDLDLSATISSTCVINNCTWLINQREILSNTSLRLSKSKLSGKSNLLINYTNLLSSSKYQLIQIMCSDMNGLVSMASKEILIGEEIRGGCTIIDETNQWIAFESLVTIDCSSLTLPNKIIMSLYGSDGKLLHVYSNTLKNTITTRLPLISNGYFQIDFIDRYGSITKFKLSNNITTSLPLTLDSNYVNSKFYAIQSNTPMNVETINVIYSLVSILDSQKEVQLSLLKNILNYLKSTISIIGYNVNDRISTLLVSPIYKLFKLSGNQLSVEDLSFWINYMLNSWLNVEKYYSKENKYYIYNNEHLNMLLDLSNRYMRNNQVSNIIFANYNLQLIQILKKRKYYSFDTTFLINLIPFNSIEELNTKQLQLSSTIQVVFPSDFSSLINVQDYENIDLITQQYNDNTTLNTLSISLFNSEGEELSVKNLVNPIVINFNLKIQKTCNISCMYMNMTTGKWSNDGIISTLTILENFTNDYLNVNLKCQTFHLTTFGILDQSKNIAELSSPRLVNPGVSSNTANIATNYAAIVAPSVIIPLFFLIIIVIIVIIVIIIVITNRKKKKSRIPTAATESSIQYTDIPLRTETKQINNNMIYDGSFEDFPSDSLNFKPLVSLRESNNNGSSDELLSNSSNSDPIEKYQVLERIGQGAFGSVFKARELKSGKIRAVKALKYSTNEDLNLMMKEGMQLMNISHPNILRVNDLFVGNSQLLYIDMDYYENGDLNNLIYHKRNINNTTEQDYKISERIILQILEQSSSALDFVHTQLKIIHRDVKPGNIFIQSLDKNEENIHVILADFGLAKQNQGSINNSYAGTPLYMPPELGLGAKYSYNTDIYSLGVSVYQIMTKDTSTSISHLYLSMDSSEVKDYLRIKMNEQTIYSERLIEMILKMLEKDPNKRPTANQLITLLNDNMIIVYN